MRRFEDWDKTIAKLLEDIGDLIDQYRELIAKKEGNSEGN